MESVTYEVKEVMAARLSRDLDKESIKNSTKPVNAEGKVRFTIQLSDSVTQEQVVELLKYSKLMSGLG